MLHRAIIQVYRRGRLKVFDSASQESEISWNKIFFAGGSTGGFYQFTNPTLVDDTIDIYDVGTNTWTVRRMSAPRSHCTAEYMSNGKVYIVGGLTTDMNSDAVDIYDIATDSFDFP